MRWLFVLLLVACNNDIDEPWQLAHDRIIAVRATPPRIAPGAMSTVDVLLGYADRSTEQRAPDAATVLSPKSLADLVTHDDSGWIVTAPDEDRLVAARAELNLPAGAPVPLAVGVAVTWPHPVQSTDGEHFGASKIVWLADTADNPVLDGMLIDGAPPTDDLIVPKQTKVPLYVEANDDVDIVNWLTSCGTMHDFDLHAAYLTVEPTDPQEGELAIVLRDDRGGVSWRTWPIHAE